MDCLEFDLDSFLDEELGKETELPLKERFLLYKQKIVATDELIKEFSSVIEENHQARIESEKNSELLSICRKELLQHLKNKDVLEGKCSHLEEEVKRLKQTVSQEHCSRQASNNVLRQYNALTKSTEEELNTLKEKFDKQRTQVGSLNRLLNNYRKYLNILSAILNENKLFPKRLKRVQQDWTKAYNQTEKSNVSIFSPGLDVSTLTSPDAGFDSANSLSGSEDEHISTECLEKCPKEQDPVVIPKRVTRSSLKTKCASPKESLPSQESVTNESLNSSILCKIKVLDTEGILPCTPRTQEFVRIGSANKEVQTDSGPIKIDAVIDVQTDLTVIVCGTSNNVLKQVCDKVDVSVHAKYDTIDKQVQTDLLNTKYNTINKQVQTDLLNAKYDTIDKQVQTDLLNAKYDIIDKQVQTDLLNAKYGTIDKQVQTDLLIAKSISVGTITDDVCESIPNKKSVDVTTFDTEAPIDEGLTCDLPSDTFFSELNIDVTDDWLSSLSKVPPLLSPIRSPIGNCEMLISSPADTFEKIDSELCKNTEMDVSKLGSTPKRNCDMSVSSPVDKSEKIDSELCKDTEMNVQNLVSTPKRKKKVVKQKKKDINKSDKQYSAYDMFSPNKTKLNTPSSLLSNLQCKNRNVDLNCEQCEKCTYIPNCQYYTPARHCHNENFSQETENNVCEEGNSVEFTNKCNIGQHTVDNSGDLFWKNLALWLLNYVENSEHLQRHIMKGNLINRNFCSHALTWKSGKLPYQQLDFIQCIPNSTKRNKWKSPLPSTDRGMLVNPILVEMNKESSQQKKDIFNSGNANLELKDWRVYPLESFENPVSQNMYTCKGKAKSISEDSSCFGKLKHFSSVNPSNPLYGDTTCTSKLTKSRFVKKVIKKEMRKWKNKYSRGVLHGMRKQKTRKSKVRKILINCIGNCKKTSSGTFQILPSGNSSTDSEGKFSVMYDCFKEEHVLTPNKFFGQQNVSELCIDRDTVNEVEQHISPIVLKKNGVAEKTLQEKDCVTDIINNAVRKGKDQWIITSSNQDMLQEPQNSCNLVVSNQKYTQFEKDNSETNVSLISGSSELCVSSPHSSSNTSCQFKDKISETKVRKSIISTDICSLEKCSDSQYTERTNKIQLTSSPVKIANTEVRKSIISTDICSLEKCSDSQYTECTDKIQLTPSPVKIVDTEVRKSTISTDICSPKKCSVSQNTECTDKIQLTPSPVKIADTEVRKSIISTNICSLEKCSDSQYTECTEKIQLMPSPVKTGNTITSLHLPGENNTSTISDNVSTDRISYQATLLCSSTQETLLQDITVIHLKNNANLHIASPQQKDKTINTEKQETTQNRMLENLKDNMAVAVSEEESIHKDHAIEKINAEEKLELLNENVQCNANENVIETSKKSEDVQISCEEQSRKNIENCTLELSDKMAECTEQNQNSFEQHNPVRDLRRKDLLEKDSICKRASVPEYQTEVNIKECIQFTDVVEDSTVLGKVSRTLVNTLPDKEQGRSPSRESVSSCSTIVLNAANSDFFLKASPIYEDRTDNETDDSDTNCNSLLNEWNAEQVKKNIYCTEQMRIMQNMPERAAEEVNEACNSESDVQSSILNDCENILAVDLFDDMYLSEDSLEEDEDKDDDDDDDGDVKSFTIDETQIKKCYIPLVRCDKKQNYRKISGKQHADVFGTNKRMCVNLGDSTKNQDIESETVKSDCTFIQSPVLPTNSDERVSELTSVQENSSNKFYSNQRERKPSLQADLLNQNTHSLNIRETKSQLEDLNVKNQNHNLDLHDQDCSANLNCNESDCENDSSGPNRNATWNDSRLLDNINEDTIKKIVSDNEISNDFSDQTSYKLHSDKSTKTNSSSCEKEIFGNCNKLSFRERCQLSLNEFHIIKPPDKNIELDKKRKYADIASSLSTPNNESKKIKMTGIGIGKDEGQNEAKNISPSSSSSMKEIQNGLDNPFCRQGMKGRRKVIVNSNTSYISSNDAYISSTTAAAVTTSTTNITSTASITTATSTTASTTVLENYSYSSLTNKQQRIAHVPKSKTSPGKNIKGSTDIIEGNKENTAGKNLGTSSNCNQKQNGAIGPVAVDKTLNWTLDWPMNIMANISAETTMDMVVDMKTDTTADISGDIKIDRTIDSTTEKVLGKTVEEIQNTATGKMGDKTNVRRELQEKKNKYVKKSKLQKLRSQCEKLRRPYLLSAEDEVSEKVKSRLQSSPISKDIVCKNKLKKPDAQNRLEQARHTLQPKDNTKCIKRTVKFECENLQGSNMITTDEKLSENEIDLENRVKELVVPNKLEVEQEERLESSNDCNFSKDLRDEKIISDKYDNNYQNHDDVDNQRKVSKKDIQHNLPRLPPPASLQMTNSMQKLSSEVFEEKNQLLQIDSKLGTNDFKSYSNTKQNPDSLREDSYIQKSVNENGLTRMQNKSITGVNDTLSHTTMNTNELSKDQYLEESYSRQNNDISGDGSLRSNDKQDVKICNGVKLSPTLSMNTAKRKYSQCVKEERRVQSESDSKDAKTLATSKISEENCVNKLSILYQCFKMKGDVFQKLHKQQEEVKHEGGSKNKVHQTVKKYLGNELTEELLDSTVNVCKKFTRYEIRKFAKYVTKFAATVKEEKYITSHTPPAPLLTPTHMRLFVLVERLDKFCPSVMYEVMLNIEFKLFRLGYSCQNYQAIHLSRFYTAFCKLKNDKNRVLRLCYDALYCLKFKAHGVIYAALSSYPGSFPVAHYNESKSCLIQTMVFLMFKKTKKIEGIKDAEKLKAILSQAFGYKESSLLSLEALVHRLLNGLRANELDAEQSLVILTKCIDNWKWTQSNIVARGLATIIDEWKIGNANETAAVSSIKLLGYIGKVFPTEAFLCGQSIAKILQVLLFKYTVSEKIEDAALGSLALLAKYHEDEIISILLYRKYDRKVPEELFLKVRPLIKKNSTILWELLDKVS